MSAASQVPYRAKHVGVCPSARGAVIAALVRARPAPVWIVVAEHARLAGQLAEDIPFFLETHAPSSSSSPSSAARVLLFPESMPETGDMREAFAASADRLTVLSALRNPHSLLVLTTPAALLQPVPALAPFAAAEFTLARGQSQSFQGLLEKLRALDYDSEAVCEAPGHYAIRGGIIDVYPVTATQPYRLDFFGDEIEDIRAFDPVTQRSGESVAAITLSATPRVRLAPSKTGLADYLPPRAANLLLVEPATLDAAFSRLARETSAASATSSAAGAGAAAAGATLAGLLPRFAALLGMSDLDEAAALFDTPGTHEITWETESLAHHRSYPADALIANERLQAEEDARARFLAQAAAWSRDGYDLAIVTLNEGEETRAREILAADPALKTLRPRYLRGTLNEGFRLTNHGSPRAPNPNPQSQNPTNTRASRGPSGELGFAG
ncbi:MAG: transcription-repair coupling factor, partial [Opitutaceae bacterium]|nr:transcription-repair coupling factor [Opitutaceae bacterium]